MLAELSVKNLALIEELIIEFGSGANIMSGETGAGKSILAGALGLITGARASADIIRAGADEAVVEALFVLDDPGRLHNIFKSLGLEFEDELILRRVISANGRGKAFVNGRMLTRTQLAQLGDVLVNISGQHDQQALLKSASQMDYLDHFGRHAELLGAMRHHWQEMNKAENAFNMLSDELREAAEKRDLLEFQLTEIEKAAPKPGEDDELSAEKNMAKDSAKLTDALEASAKILGGDSGNIVERLAVLRRNLERAAVINPALNEARMRAEDCYHQLADLSVQLDRLSRSYVIDPGRLEWIDERLNILAKLKRKFGPSLADVLEKAKKLSSVLDQLDGSELELSRLRRDLNIAQKKAAETAEKLSAARKKAGDCLALKLTDGLRPLGFPKIEIKVLVEKPSEKMPGPKGWDHVEFLFCPNPGEGLKPLAKIASGGELSRLMLALKTVEEGPSDQLLVFDEIDSGLGGITAEAVAAKMAELSLKQQVVVITHLPQMAALDGRHFVVSKVTDNNRTVTAINELKADQRSAELARMLGGASPSPEARALAKQLLEQNKKN